MGEKALRFQKWFKNNVPTVAIIAMCAIYVVYGFIHIQETGKTPLEIIADGAISLFMGFTIKSLFNAQGVANGESSEDFINTKHRYGGILEDISSYQQCLDKYCEIENNKLLETAQKNILQEAFLDYEMFRNKGYRDKKVYKALSKREKKVLKRAYNVKPHFISSSLLLSDCSITINLGRDLSSNKKSYLRKSNTKTLIIMLISSFFFGFFSPTLNVDWAGMIWSLIQVAWFLGFGSLQYSNGFNYIVDEYRSVLIEKTNKLEMFKNMYNENPKKFKDEPIIENPKIEPKSITKEDLITYAEKLKNAVEVNLEPKFEIISQIDNLKPKNEEHIKTFEEICEEHRKEKEDANNK